MEELEKKHYKGCFNANSGLQDPDNYECYCHIVKDGRDISQECPDCKTKLQVIFNYPGGGSHYWVLRCSNCKVIYDYSNYNRKLEKAHRTHCL